uniref:Uncharacterized protein n=1 Tax=Cacopsylla melanoneura TaxID=428564 RepID=A0A8D8W5T3_9HEMI
MVPITCLFENMKTLNKIRYYVYCQFNKIKEKHPFRSAPKKFLVVKTRYYLFLNRNFKCFGLLLSCMTKKQFYPFLYGLNITHRAICIKREQMLMLQIVEQMVLSV